MGRKRGQDINWVAPCKPAQYAYFIAIFQVAQNRLKVGMSTLFVLKNVLLFVIFFSAEKCLSLCPSPNNVGFQSLRAKTLCVCLLRHWRKTQGHFFTEKELAWQISVDSEPLEKSLQNCHIGPACTEPFNCNMYILGHTDVRTHEKAMS